jgi:hypothetical protein
MRRVFSSPVLAWLAMVFLLALAPCRAASAKTDLDADLSRDGRISNDDPGDNGVVQETPPGLPVTVGGLELILLRCKPRNLSSGYVRLAAVSAPGEWERLKDPRWPVRFPRASGGRIRVWRDPEKTTLILDSHDPLHAAKIWELDRRFVMLMVPSTLYVEGVDPSGEDGDVVLVLQYGQTRIFTDRESTRDILVITVHPASEEPQPSAVVKNEPILRGPTQEQLAIWCFDGSPAFSHGTPIPPTTEDVSGTPALTMLYADIDGNGKGGIDYTDVEGVKHLASQAAAWDDIRKSEATDAEFRVAIATTGWKDISIRFDYKSRSADTFRLQYSLDGGTQWGDAVTGTIPLRDGYIWQTLPAVDLAQVDAIENLPAVLFRFYDLRETGNDEFVFDNLEFIGVRIPPATGPRIRAADSTTDYLRLEPDNEGYVGAVIADPTDPARILGIDFDISDPDTPVEQLTVTATAPADRVTLELTGENARRNLKITPLAVGYTNIDVNVSDGTGSATYRVRYATSAAAANPPGPRFHSGVSDVSAATGIDAATFLAANDEDRSLWLFHRDASGLFRKAFDTAPWLGLGSTRETDVEGCARNGSLAYWIGSHGNNTDGTPRPDRQRLFATTISGTGQDTTLACTGYYANLRTDLVNWDSNNLHGKGADYYALEASAADGVWPKRIDGFNIEGLAMGENDSTLYIGFRAPIVPASNQTKALVVPVINAPSLVGGSPAAGPALFGPPLEWDLGGRGVRSLARTAGGAYLIVAGPPDDATGSPPSDFRLYSWSGQADDQPALLGVNLSALGAPGSFEAIVEPAGGVSSTVQLLSDNGTTDWYGDSQESKTLNANWQKFRSDWVSAGTGEGGHSFTLGGVSGEMAWSVFSTRDGGSILLGGTASSGAGNSDFLVCKTNAAGKIEWQKTYGGPENDGASGFFERPVIRQTFDGGYLIVGTTSSFGAGASDIWVLRLAADGDILWQKAFGGPAGECGTGAALCRDGTFAVAGKTRSFGAVANDIWVLKLRADGGILWQCAYGSAEPGASPLQLKDERNTRGMEELADGDLIVSGNNSWSAPLLMRLGPGGVLRWAIEFGESSDPIATNAVKSTSDGGIVVASGGGCIVQCIDGQGNYVWQKYYVGVHQGGDKEVWLTHAWGLDETPDKGYIVGTFALLPSQTQVALPALLRLDGNGTPLWCRGYTRISREDEKPGTFPYSDGDYMRERFFSVSACPNGTYLVAGKPPITQSGGQDMLYIRFNADGTLPGYSAPLLEVEATKTAPYPNPNQGHCDIAGRNTTATGIDTTAVPADTDFAPGRVLP